MIDVAREQLLTKREAAERCRVSVLTVNRWIYKGIKRTGKRLETVRVGGSVRTSVEALARFAVHPAQPIQPTPVVSDAGREALSRMRTIKQRKAK